jgi:hypothetical protein
MNELEKLNHIYDLLAGINEGDDISVCLHMTSYHKEKYLFSVHLFDDNKSSILCQHATYEVCLDEINKWIGKGRVK